ncbi:MAG: type IX secretion system sortase PorU, partial [Flavobacteriaceae bacterium]|nr:type IX secretion system sortase PorU [Flavobacteriaceae bacterium]
MKKIFLLLALSSFLPIFSQSELVSINWEDSRVYQTERSTIILPSFQEANFNFNFDHGIKFTKQWKTNAPIGENSINVSNVTYSSISRDDLQDLNPATIPDQLEYSLKNSKARDVNYAYFEISPIIRDNGVYKKINSFRITYDFQSIGNRGAMAARAITPSVLRNGNWFRFYVEQTGVHRISKGFLESLGMNLNNVDPRTIKIYGNGGRMLPLLNSTPYPMDLTENAIQFIGEQDGVFDNDDFILFYGEGPKQFNEESITNINIFTDKSYYYVNLSPGLGKRISAFQQPTGTPDLIIDTYSEYQFHEIDDFNIVKIGRRWFGDRFSINNEQNFEFEFPNIINTETVKLKVYTAAISESNSSMDVLVNGSNVDTFTFSAINDPILADGESFNGDINVNSSTITVGLNYNNNGNPSAVAYLDFISLEATSQLRYNDGQFRFKNYEVAQNLGIAQYTIDNASNISEVWDITDIYNVSNAINSDSSSSFVFTANMGSQKEYIAVDPSDYYEPLREANSSVTNQDIKGTIFLNAQGDFEDLDYIIVAPSELMAQANRLAQINRNQYGLNVKVLDLQSIYTEFSSGNQDVGAIRNLVKYVYNNASVPENRLKYLCLFGDSSYDYKDRISGNTNIVPSWHAYSSFNLTNSFISDDFFGMMDDNEGTLSSSDRLDVAVGRILADTPQRANELVDKVEQYYQKEAFGSWRNNFLVVSDDV